MPLSWITGEIFPVVMIGTICLALIASERGNMVLCRFLVAMVGIEIVIQLVN